MPYDEPEETDPMELMGHAAYGTPESMDQMAENVVDEFIRLGFDEPKLMQMFRDPFFGLTHSIWRSKGDAFCASLVERVAARWRR
ncbi:MAG: hypothetical protein HUU21_03200 [Polyangiaceae bacterium]|nr:hypothetical protein [Polyangiaceae bacterium]NUQ72537.1 hypothetical protein [Polyangiaceae bacterium]